MMLKNKIKEITNSKYFIPCFVIFVNIALFVICNFLFEPRYETVDDFTIMNIISKLDGTYSIYAVHIHPLLSFIIMILYMTGISINWYTIVMVILQFISFTTIGIVLLKLNKKIGSILYLSIVVCFFYKIVLVINYTSVAAITILAGVIALMYWLDTENKKSKIVGFILIAIGTMLRWKSLIIVLPFFVVYGVYYTIKNRNTRAIKTLLTIFITFLLIYISNSAIYQLNPVYKKYSEFDNIRTYFFDFNVLNYEKDKEILEKCGWTYTDWETFYTYSFADEKFYTTENLYHLKDNIDNGIETHINKITNTFVNLYNIIKNSPNYLILLTGICLLALECITTGKKRSLVLAIFLMNILINYMLVYTKVANRVFISLYTTTFVIMSYIYIYIYAKRQSEKTQKR